MKQLPKFFGPYEVLDQIGSGGMGTIYRAVDTRLEREVALKVLHRDLDVSGARERFVNEARLVSSLNHPNICTVFDIGEQDDDLFLVMEMLHGQSLKERIAAGPISAEEIRSISIQAALALEAAHARSIVHRDIKPANIFLALDEKSCTRVKILDFGLAKNSRSTRAARNAGLTRHGATVGTVEYMSPEQACGYETDARSDLFSLGAVLYEMATGKTPFCGATSAVIYSELLNQEPLPARDTNLNLPADLDRIIQRLLRKDREERLQTASELVHELGHACSGERVTCRHGIAAHSSPQALVASSSLGTPAVSRVHGQGEHRGRLHRKGITFLTPGHNPQSGSLIAPPSTPRKSKPRTSSHRLALRVLLSCTIIMLLAMTVRNAWAGFSEPHSFHGTLQVEPLQNGTGNASLDKATRELLVRELSHSATYTVYENAEAGPKTAVERLGDAPISLVTGSISQTGTGYAVHVQVHDAASKQTFAEADELAPSIEQIPAAIERAAAGVRDTLEGRSPRT